MANLTRDTRVTINYQVDGTGEPCYLLFNGNSLPLEFWGAFAADLADHATVIRFDQRNAGTTEFTGDFSLNDIAADAAHLAAALGHSRVIAIGHAWGGRVAQVFARDYPHLVRGLVICGTGGQFPPADLGETGKAARDARRAGDRPAWDTLLENLYCARGFATRDPETFTEIANLIWHHPPRPEARWNPAVSPSPSYWGRATMPVLLVYGEQDKNGTPQNARDLHQRLPSSRLAMLPEAGHFVIREQAAQVLGELNRFSATLGP